MTTAYTDGSTCPRNPGAGGWAATLDGQMLSGAAAHATNNQMELTAIRQAILACADGSALDLFTDSALAIGLLTLSYKAKDPTLRWMRDEILALSRQKGLHVRIGKTDAHVGPNLIVDLEAKRQAKVAHASGAESAGWWVSHIATRLSPCSGCSRTVDAAFAVDNKLREPESSMTRAFEALEVNMAPNVTKVDPKDLDALRKAVEAKTALVVNDKAEKGTGVAWAYKNAKGAPSKRSVVAYQSGKVVWNFMDPLAPSDAPAEPAPETEPAPEPAA